VHATLERLRDTVGVWTPNFEFVAPSELAVPVGALESAGFPAVWLPESWGREAMTGALVVLEESTDLVVATGIASIYARDAMATASAARTLAQRSGGRFVLGLGVSHRPLVERGRKGSYDKPIPAMTRFLDELASAPLLNAESGERPAVVLAALGPRMLELAAARTDGAHTYLVTAAHTEVARSVLGAGGFLGVELSCVLGEDREEYLRRAHAHLNDYTGLENYRASWRRLGFGDEDFVRGGSDRLCDALVVHGDEVAILDAARRHLDAGADHVCLQVLGDSLADAPLDAWTRLGAALRAR